ncbi:MAG: hypothetical protein ACJ79G_20465 [Myxococcales bacterium]
MDLMVGAKHADEALARLFEDKNFVAFSYEGIFVLRFESPGPVRVTRLEIFADWWIGKLDCWGEMRNHLPLEIGANDWQTPYMAARLATLIGRPVIDAIASDSGQLTISFTSGDPVVIDGRAPDWEFSWYASPENDDRRFFANCDSSGTLYSRAPTT